MRTCARWLVFPIQSGIVFHLCHNEISIMSLVRETVVVSHYMLTTAMRLMWLKNGHFAHYICQGSLKDLALITKKFSH